ncbi:MAG: SMC-Scp complex subunit ScpB [Patulibacter sp.]
MSAHGGPLPEDPTPADDPTDAAIPADPGVVFPTAIDPDGPIDARTPPAEQSGLASEVEALLFLSSDPVAVNDLATACDTGPDEVADALRELQVAYAPGRRGLVLRTIGGGWLLSTAPETEPSARRLMAAPRTPPLTPAQAETLAIVAYLQPVSRPDISRIRGVAAEAACASLVERGMIEEAGRSQFGAVLYRTTGLFLKLFGLDGLAELPDPAEWDPTPEEEATLRERLLRAGDARAGNDPTAGATPEERDEAASDGLRVADGEDQVEESPAASEDPPPPSAD